MRRRTIRGLAELLLTLPSRFTASDRLKEIATERSRAQLQALRDDISGVAESLGFVAACGPVVYVNETDGIRMIFKHGDIIHLRPSGNAPELRMYVEADTQDRAEKLLSQGLNSVANWLA